MADFLAAVGWWSNKNNHVDMGVLGAELNTYGTCCRRTGQMDVTKIQRYNPEIHEPRTGWDAISLEMAREEGRELFVDQNGEVWTADKKYFAGKIRKEEPVC